MIRPLTVATFLLACSSGLYLYQSKHEVQVLDRTIEHSVHETGALREQSRLLAAEWTMLTSPERLRQFSDTYLKLKTIAPSQFTSMADLNNRLPAPQVDTPVSGTDEDGVPVMVDTMPQPISENGPGVAAKLPVPPQPVARPAPAVASATHPGEPKGTPLRQAGNEPPARQLASAETRAAEARAMEARMSEQRQAEQRVLQRVAEAHAVIHEPPAPRPIAMTAPRPVVANVPVYVAPVLAPVPSSSRPVAAQSGSFNGSLLGMAHGTLPPAPRPTPVNASYNTN